MTILVTYANNAFRKSQELNSKTAKEVGCFNEIIPYSPKDIEPDFFQRNRNILSQNRGNGYWLWKPYFIRRSLEMLNSDDFLFYCDSGAYFIKPITPLIDTSCNTGQELIVFELPFIEKIWTKRDAFILMDCDSPEYSESKQRLASFSLWKKSEYTMDFADEYLRYAQDERIITDLENQCGYPNHPGFKDHRHDQSIFSLLTKKHGLDAFRDPSQPVNEAGDFYDNSQYEQLIEHTRRGSFSYRVRRRIRSLTNQFSGRLIRR